MFNENFLNQWLKPYKFYPIVEVSPLHYKYAKKTTKFDSDPVEFCC